MKQLIYIMVGLLLLTMATASTPYIATQGRLQNATSGADFTGSFVYNETITSSDSTLLFSEQETVSVVNGIFNFFGGDTFVMNVLNWYNAWVAGDITKVIKINDETSSSEIITSVPLSIISAMSNNSKFLDGQSASYYLDDTTIGNCSVDGACDAIAYDSEISLTDTNCTAEGSCPLITYDSELAYIDNCSVSNSCSLITYDSELSYIGNCSGATCDVTNTGTLDGYEATAFFDDTTIGNCSVDLSCSAITYDSELSYIGNCSGASCDITNTGTLDGYEASALLDDTNETTRFNNLVSDCPAGEYVQNITSDGTPECSEPATGSQLTEDQVEAYIFDNDNTDNFNMSTYNITFVAGLKISSNGTAICIGNC